MGSIVHIVLHFIVPLAVARVAFAHRWKKAWLIMVLTMAVDLDHLLANPIYDPSRCSIGFHPLHAYPAIAVYLILSAIPGTRLVGVGLIIHMALDGIDCFRMTLGG